MDPQTLLFYIFSAITVLSALRVITARNPVHSALFLVLAFCSAACIWMMLAAEFLAITLVLVYVGAVMVLFLFVVMMLDINLGKLREGFWGYLPLAATIGVVIVLIMSAVLLHGFWATDANIPAESAKLGGTKSLGILIYTEYVYAFEIAAAILLVAIIAAVALTMRGRKDSKYFDPAAAVKVKASDRLRVVRMKAESNRPVNEPAAAAAPTEKGSA